MLSLRSLLWLLLGLSSNGLVLVLEGLDELLSCQYFLLENPLFQILSIFTSIKFFNTLTVFDSSYLENLFEIANLNWKLFVSTFQYLVFLQQMFVSINLIEDLMFTSFQLMFGFIKNFIVHFSFVFKVLNKFFQSLILIHIIG